MIMGKIVSNKKYEMYEYVVAVLITSGMVAFLYGSEDIVGPGKTATTTVSGAILLVRTNHRHQIYIPSKLRGSDRQPGTALWSYWSTIKKETLAQKK
jgi:hypothetical protein